VYIRSKYGKIIITRSKFPEIVLEVRNNIGTRFYSLIESVKNESFQDLEGDKDYWTKNLVLRFTDYIHQREELKKASFKEKII